MDEPPIDSRSFFRAAMISEALVLLAGIALGAFLQRPPGEQIHLLSVDWLWGLLAALPMVAALWLAERFPLGPLKSLEQIFEQVLKPLFRSWPTWQLFAVSAMAGVGEEILFRGAIQGGVEQFSGSPWLAIVIASVLFGLAHPMSRLYVGVATVIGFYFGWLLWSTDNLLVPIVAHGAYDFVALLYMLRGDRTSVHAPAHDDDPADREMAADRIV